MLTVEQVEERRKWVGASDVAAIAGVNPYSTAWDVWAAKTGRLPALESNPAMDAGSRFEAPVMDWAEEQLGPMKRDVLLPAPDGYPPIVSRLDGMVIADRAPAEGKTSGLFGPLDRKAWGDEGSDVVPEQHIVQVQIQMLCSGACRGHIPAFLGGRGFSMFHIDRSDDVIESLCETVDKFWRDCVQADTPPDDSTPSLAVIKRITRKTGIETSIDPQLVADWQEAKAAAKATKDASEVAQARLIASMGDAEVGLPGEGHGRVTYFQQTRRGLDTKALRAAHPNIAAAFAIESEYRVLRIAKPKKG